MIIFDLDHTVIDSSHRQSTLPCGSLDLAHWIENNTPEKIQQDKLLPLAELWKANKRAGRVVGVCTARVLQDADYEFLADNGLQADFILSREMGDNSGDGILKEKLLKNFAEKAGFSFTEFCANVRAFYDDNKIVLETLDKLNIKAYNALELNKQLKG